MFEGVDWLGVVVGVVAAFAAGWFWYSPKGFYPAWSASAKVQHAPGDRIAQFDRQGFGADRDILTAQKINRPADA